MYLSFCLIILGCSAVYLSSWIHIYLFQKVHFMMFQIVNFHMSLAIFLPKVCLLNNLKMIIRCCQYNFMYISYNLGRILLFNFLFVYVFKIYLKWIIDKDVMLFYLLLLKIVFKLYKNFCHFNLFYLKQNILIHQYWIWIRTLFQK